MHVPSHRNWQIPIRTDGLPAMKSKKRSEAVAVAADDLKGGKKKKSKTAVTAVTSPITDVVLFGRVVQLVRDAPRPAAVTVDSTYASLCAAIPEYRRKPVALLNKAIGECLRHLRETEPVAPRSEGGRDEMEGDEEDGDEEEDGDAAEGRSNLMNARLRKSYSKAAAAPSTPAPASASGSGESAIGKADLEIPSARYSDVGGIDACLQDVRELIEHPIRHPEIYRHLGVRPPTGVLLHGPPGTGKTLLAYAIAGELGVPFLSISAPEIVSGFSGQSEKRIRTLFQEAQSKAPCVVFIDEIDAITPKRESAQREMERRIVAQLLTCMDNLGRDDEYGEPPAPVIVIGATNRPDSLDPALRRAGRFDREIGLGVPDAAARARILRVLTRKLRLQGDFDMESLARGTPGFVGADLVALTKEAAMVAVNRIFHSVVMLENSEAKAEVVAESEDPLHVRAATQASDLLKREQVAAHLRHAATLTEAQLAPLFITMEDFESALPKVQPSAKREGFATVPDVSWADIGALESVRADLQMAIVNAIRHPEAYAVLGLAHPAGVLMYGPPGCGKTLLARAVANECGASFISIKGPELLNKYVGESERAVRQVFERARASAPCVVFFDEMDALAPKRAGESQASERVVNQLLTELDGLDARKNVFVVAATNRPDIIDAAMMRPGRLEKLLYVPLPSPSDRAQILRTLTKERPRLAASVDLETIANDKRCTGFSGADLSALVREASMAALSQAFTAGGGAVPQHSLTVDVTHFETAFTRVSPSVSESDAKRYESMQKSLSKNRLN